MKRYREHTAIDAVSFDAERGRRVGLLGSIGAGQKPLMRMLSQVTPPTSGPITPFGIE